MNNTPREIMKSLLIGTAALAGLLLWLKYQPKPPADAANLGTGELLCAGFTDPSLPSELTITRPKSAKDSVPAEAVSLRLVKEKGKWVIQTADSAPADNIDRFTMVFAPLLRLAVLSDIKELDTQNTETVTEFHRQCKLLDPTDLSSSDMKDAGIRLTITGKEGEKYADLIIGSVPEGSSELRDIRYIRFPGESRVFTADFSGEELAGTGEEKPLPYTDRLSAEPADWMNLDLLRISRWNIARMSIFHYSFQEDNQIVPNLLHTFSQDKDRSLGRVWEQIQLITFGENGSPQENEITGENRFSDNDLLNTKAETITHLQIKSLLRKPEGLASLIKEDRPIGEWTAFADQLKPLGFFFTDHHPAYPAEIEPALFGKKGTVSLTMNDGIKLTLLFGAELPDKGESLLVIPTLDEKSFPKPVLKDIPEGASESEKKSIADENRLQENEYQLNCSEAKEKLNNYKSRFSDWIFFIDPI